MVNAEHHCWYKRYETEQETNIIVLSNPLNVTIYSILKKENI